MTTRRVHWVVFHSAGSFMDEVSAREIPAWDPRLAVEMSAEIVERYNARPFGFCFETRLHADPIDDGEGGSLRVEPKVVDKSGMFFVGGVLSTVDEVEARNDPNEQILLSNMRGGTPIVIVSTRSFRVTKPFEEADVLIDNDGAILDRGDAPKHVEYRARKRAE